MRAPHFSVVMPLFDKAPYVQDAVASVLGQRCGDLELLVVDDGSRDGGADLLAPLRDPRLRIVRQSNAGVSVARNRGIALARGPWITFLDADDWQHPDYLCELLRLQRAHPGARALACGYLRFDGARLSPAPWRLPPQRPTDEWIQNLPSRWMQGPAFFTGSIAARRSLLQAMQPCFPPGETQGEDLDLWFRLAERTAIAFAPRPLVAYRLDAHDSLSDRHDPGELPPWLARLARRAEAAPPDTPWRRPALGLVAQQQLSLARQALSQGRRGLALAWLLQAAPAVTSRRWWATAAMALACPPTLVRRYLVHIAERTPRLSAGPDAVR